MKVALISTYTHPVALGLRYVSSYLKSAGHDVEAIFMSSKKDIARADYSPRAIEVFIERCRSADLIGMSVMTNTFNRATMLTEAIRKAGIKTPIIWGGTHATVAPAECLETADMVCLGEGEEQMRQLLERLEDEKDPLDVGGIGFRANSMFGNPDMRINPVLPLLENLDDIPFPDYELHTHWVIDDGELVPARPELLRGALHRLRVETTRGCPFSCHFCNNTSWQQIYKNKGKWVRTRSNDNVIAELEKAVNAFPSIEEINIIDDLFFVRSEEEIEDFVVKYQQKVNLPIEFDAHPNLISREKIATLTRIPVSLISMGIQSGCPETLKNIYHRHTPLEKIIEGIDTINDHGLKAEYHYLVNNPFESDESMIETMRFAATYHKGPAVLRIFPLIFYPGSPLYDRARREGIIGDRHEIAYTCMYSGNLQLAAHNYLSTWLHTVLHLRNAGVPRWLCHRLIDVVTNRGVRRCIDRKCFKPIAFATYQLFRKLHKNLIYRPFIRPIKSLKNRKRKLRYKELHPEDELTAPRNLMGTDGAQVISQAKDSSKSRSPLIWTLPRPQKQDKTTIP